MGELQINKGGGMTATAFSNGSDSVAVEKKAHLENVVWEAKPVHPLPTSPLRKRLYQSSCTSQGEGAKNAVFTDVQCFDLETSAPLFRQTPSNPS